MAYTAPAGNAVNFQQTGVAYTAPAGNAVNFAWTLTGAGLAELSFSVSVTAQHGVAGSAATNLSLVVASDGVCAPYGRTEYLDLAFVGSAEAWHPVTGNCVVTIGVTGSGTGRMAYVASATEHLQFSGSAIGAANSFATGSTTFQLLASATGQFSPPGFAFADLVFEAQADGYRAPVGLASGSLRFSGGATGLLSTLGIGTAQARFSAAATGYVGRGGVAAGKLIASASASGVLGSSALCAAQLQFSGLSDGVLRSVFSGAVDGQLAFNANGRGGNGIDISGADVAFVMTKTNSVFALT